MKEVFWARRDKISLLIEVIRKEEPGALKEGALDEIISIRCKLQSEAFDLFEQAELEKKLTSLLAFIFQKAEFYPALTADAFFLSLQKEFKKSLFDMQVALNDYNFALQKWLNYVKQPWFGIFKFAFEIRRSKLLRIV